MNKLDEYYKFLAEKQATVHDCGFEIDEQDLNPKLFPFQRYCVKRALSAGRFAMFEDCGLGKTFQQLEWAYQVMRHVNRPVLILAPLGVVGQTVQEGAHFGYDFGRFPRGGFHLSFEGDDMEEPSDGDATHQGTRAVTQAGLERQRDEPCGLARLSDGVPQERRTQAPRPL